MTTENTAATPPDVAGMSTVDLNNLDDVELADALEAVEAEASSARRREAGAKLRADVIRALLLQRLGAGEVIVASSGRALWRDEEAPAGKAKVNEGAILENAAKLPERLQPSMEWKLPTITALRTAERNGEVPRGLVDQLLDKPETAAAVRWRTVDS